MNVFNHQQFGGPAGEQLDVSEPTFGEIAGASVIPRIRCETYKYADASRSIQFLSLCQRANQGG
jgi:hypothetical protein